jgi:hypothetical protein
MSDDDVVVPTHEDLYETRGLNDDDPEWDYVLVEKEADPSWRHGCYMSSTWKRKSDNTFWFASYCVSTDGETNELRDGECDIIRVYPVTKTVQVTEYVTKEKL